MAVTFDNSFNSYISTKALEGYVVVDKNESAFTAVLSKPPEKVNHVLHGLITLFTCVWGIVWIVLANKAKSGTRIRVSFDSSGNLVEEKMKG
ncbi:MAG: hypothetical protein HYR66_05125 [Sphingobacteriales bacterium]|nr:hypothetical protein [Sphingobacteriales bacterium]